MLKVEKKNLHKPLPQWALKPGHWRDGCVYYHYTIAPLTFAVLLVQLPVN